MKSLPARIRRFAVRAAERGASVPPIMKARNRRWYSRLCVASSDSLIPTFPQQVDSRKKRVAIVGSSTSLVGARQGARIDAADVVVRVNDFRSSGHTDDVGERTTHWAVGICPLFNARLRANGPPVEVDSIDAIWMHPNAQSEFRDEYQMFLRAVAPPMESVEMMPSVLGRRLRWILGFRPTTGLMAIIMARRAFPEAELLIAGFGKYGAAGFAGYYWQPANRDTGHPHDFWRENRYLDRLTDLGALRRLDSRRP